MTLAFKARVQDSAVASYRYRVLTPIAFLTERGHAVELYDESRFDQYRAIVFSKAYKAADQALAQRARQAGKRVLLDLCDDHFFNPHDVPKYRQVRRDLLAMAALADGVICSTPVLARAVQREAGLKDPPAVAPDLYEQASVSASSPAPRDQPARLLWFGRHGSPNAAAGMGDLLLIREALASACALRPFELVVCSDSRERYDELFAGFPVPTRYVEWTPQSFDAELARADGVLIPLSDNPFVAAKTHNRLSLALSAGVPVVADRLDAYAEFGPFCVLGDWREGLETLLLRPEEARARAAGARAHLEAHWSIKAIAPRWEAALGLASSEPSRAAAGVVRAPESAAAMIPHAVTWLAGERRNDRPWLLAGPVASPEAVAAARAEGYLAMSLDDGFTRFEVDAAYVIDAEMLAAQAEALHANARFLLVPGDVHHRGWAAGRGLASWAVDLPVLRQFQDEGRLVRFDLWTGDAQGLFGDLETEEIPLRLLAQAGVRSVRCLGLDPVQPNLTGLDDLTSILDRNTGGIAELVRSGALSYAAYTVTS